MPPCMALWIHKFLWRNSRQYRLTSIHARRNGRLIRKAAR